MQDIAPMLGIAEESASFIASPYRPVIQMHGMGDFCNNPIGMVPLRNKISQTLSGAYVKNVCITGGAGDALNGFFMTMDEQVDVFAEQVRGDPKLANGFNAIGYSQGNLVIRGYIQRYNDPPIFNFVSVHGPMLGVVGFPNCQYSSAICRTVDYLISLGAYNAFTQSHLTQANYFRDPMRIPVYKKMNHFLTDINNEGSSINATYAKNFGSLESLMLVKALGDTIVIPNDSEWFGQYQDGSSTTKLAMNETAFYQRNLFGLKDLDEAGKIFYDTTDGEHMKFSEEKVLGWVTKFFKN